MKKSFLAVLIDVGPYSGPKLGLHFRLDANGITIGWSWITPRSLSEFDKITETMSES